MAGEDALFKLISDALPRLKQLAEGLRTDRDLADLADPLIDPLEVFLGAVQELFSELDDAGSEWRAFLKEHPELRGCIFAEGTGEDGETYPTEYCYDTLRGPALERLVLAALRRGGPEGMSNQEILVAMYGTLDEATGSDGDREEAANVPGLVWSLNCRGLVERTRKRQGSIPALWRLCPPDDDVCHLGDDDGRPLCAREGREMPVHDAVDCESLGHTRCPICELFDA